MSDYVASAEWYDRVYAHIGKDYAAEAAVVDGLVRARVPGARSLLDVGCGTGLHLAQFAELYDEVAGVDLEPNFVARARSRCPGVRVTQGDMRSFDLGRTFDVVTSLFSAIGHVGGVDDLHRAVATMAAHVAPGGVLVVEPWLQHDAWRDGAYGVEIMEAPDSTLIRASHSSSDGSVSVVRMSWLETSRTGIRRLDEELRITRFTQDELRGAFEAAGLSAQFDEAGTNHGGRGLWIGLR